MRGALIAAGLLAAAAAAQAQPVASADQAKALVAQQFKVQALRARETEVDGAKAWEVTVVAPEGSGSSSFAVSTLVVDAETGKLVPQFRHQTTGYRVPAAPNGQGTRQGLADE